MNTYKTETLSEKLNELSKKGYTDDFKAGETSIKGVYSEKEYSPEELKITDSFRFEGATNPSDEATLLVIEASDGTKGTLTITNNYQSNQNAEMVRKIERVEKSKK